MKLSNFIKAIIIVLMLSSCNKEINNFSVNYSEDFRTINSSITNIDYPLSIYLPPGYNESNNNYPVIYALDGQVLYSTYLDIITTLNIEVIVVSIHEGPSGRRDIDYILPGSLTYYNFLIEELIPFIETNYKASSSNRTLFGVSNGGIMVNSALLSSTPEALYFSNYVSVDSPLQFIEMISLIDERAELSNQLNANLILTSALLEGIILPFDEDVTAFKQLIEQKNFQGLNISRYSFEVDHFNVARPSFELALQVLYN